MNWFKKKNRPSEKDEVSVEEIKKTAAQYINGLPLYSHIEQWWNEKDIEFFFTAQKLLQTKQENDELKAVLDGNEEYYGNYQATLLRARAAKVKVQDELAQIQYHFQLEKRAYEKLYIENRELRAKLYAVERELELKDIK